MHYSLLSLGKGLALYKNVTSYYDDGNEAQRFINSKLSTMLFMIYKQDMYSNESESGV